MSLPLALYQGTASPSQAAENPSSIVILSAAKHLFFLVETNKKQILRADYIKVFK
jgi:hypothetical protein